MAFSVQMPALGESVTEGTVTRWLKQEGDRVEVDEPLLEVSTDKVDTEIPSPAAGVLQKIVAQEDETVEVGAELAVIGDGSDDAGSGDSSSTGGATPSEEAEEATPRAEQPQAEPEPAPEPAAAPSSGGSAQGTPVTMPALGESVTEGTVTRWLKQVGDSVEVDEPLLEVSTDKVDTEIPSPVAGTLLEITAAEDETVDVGGQLAVIGSGSPAPARQEAPKPQPEAPKQQEAPKQEAPKPAPQPEAPKPQPEAPKQEAPQQQAPKQQAGEETGGGAPYVTPLVRKLASEHNIDLSTLKGTGVGGRIRKQDVLAAVEAAKAPAPAPQQAAPAASAPAQRVASTPAVDTSGKRGTVQKLPRLRQIVAQRTRESLQVSAQLTQVFEVDVTKIARLRSRAKAAFEQREGTKLTFLPFFAKAAVEALKQHPVLNASIDEEKKEVVYHGAEHLGIAIDTERGLLNAVIHNAGDLNLAGLSHKIADLASRARANKLTPDELTGGTFSLTNLGSNGALFDTPIIQQPQVGILGVGVVKKRPVVVTDENGDDTIAIRSMAYLALTYDHRLVDGADAGRFLTTVKNRLEEGAFEADLGL
ncbi:2-oxoglutarate dehydrogenase E2 component (dihydrolipoamide succinyltransferase) [Saccharothrix coeruleofusca]|uniref:2-oxoglutarate dehydrogenase, E2 component, dihydrolipoamide succinyltransferase n=1 Tax=Saccharothrix coeruleofusca TaxID=33919 RepID=UPI001AE3BACE|nr:2-oxoglutarate dehydrogenase, E2 component, dihydrolipoamide succinyltransferase [Saccharothrix coeruleofusca]MBP2334358.1 2-oxoglutarate dehydrogenase E2 component (dihydrolipoamide succinyltransferase) [Saccharothrix coeruleofusca]